MNPENVRKKLLSINTEQIACSSLRFAAIFAAEHVRKYAEQGQSEHN